MPYHSLPTCVILIMEIVNTNNQRYLVKWKTDEVNMTIEKIGLIKEYRECDVVLRKDPSLYFCQLIQEIEFQEI